MYEWRAFKSNTLWNLASPDDPVRHRDFGLQSIDANRIVLTIFIENMTPTPPNSAAMHEVIGEFLYSESRPLLPEITGFIYSASVSIEDDLFETQRWSEGVPLREGIGFAIDETWLPGNDYFEGSVTVAGDDSVQGLAGDDRFKGNGDNSGDYFFGGDGVDTAIYRGKRDDYLIQLTDAIRDGRADDGTLVSGRMVIDLVSRRDGRDYLNEVERLEFSDRSIAFDVGATQNAGKAKLFIGSVAHSLVNDATKLGIILYLIDNGYSDITSLSQLAIDTGVIATLAGGGSNEALIGLVTKNILGQSDPNVEAMLASYMDGTVANYSQAQFLGAITMLEVNQQRVDLVGIAETGMEYITVAI